MSDIYHRDRFDSFIRYDGCPKCGGDVRVEDRDHTSEYICCYDCDFKGWVKKEVKEVKHGAK